MIDPFTPRSDDDRVQLNIVKRKSVASVAKEIIWRIDGCERDRSFDIDNSPVDPDGAIAWDPEMVPIIWNTPNGNLTAQDLKSQLPRAFRYDVGDYARSAESVLGNINEITRPQTPVVFLVLGIATSDVTALDIYSHDVVFRNPEVKTYIYTPVRRPRNFQDLKRYRSDKQAVLNNDPTRPGSAFETHLENIDVLLYLMDRMQWNWYTADPSTETVDAHVHPRMQRSVREIGIFENQDPFTEISETNVVVESI